MYRSIHEQIHISADLDRYLFVWWVLAFFREGGMLDVMGMVLLGTMIFLWLLRRCSCDDDAAATVTMIAWGDLTRLREVTNCTWWREQWIATIASMATINCLEAAEALCEASTPAMSGQLSRGCCVGLRQCVGRQWRWWRHGDGHFCCYAHSQA